jgi:hypothetical protein
MNDVFIVDMKKMLGELERSCGVTQRLLFVRIRMHVTLRRPRLRGRKKCRLLKAGAGIYRGS